MQIPMAGRPKCDASLHLVLALLAGLAAGLCLRPASVPAADTELSQAGLIEAVREVSGVCAVLGGDDALLTQLGAGGRRLAHVLEPDPARVQAVREVLLKRGLYGLVSVEHWTGPALPYADHLLNLLLVEKPGGIPESELRRVLAPDGTAWVRQGHTWRALRKPWPKEYGEWTHWRHGADGNMVSRDVAVQVPSGLRWVAGPAQDAGGRKYYNDHVLVTTRGRNFYVYDDEIVARDAFNGLLLWARPLRAYTFREIGTAVPSFLQEKARLASRSSRVRPVAVGDRLYVAAEGKLAAVEAGTGQTVTEFGSVTQPRELLVEGETLLVTDTNAMRAYNIRSQSLLWETPLNAQRVVAGDGAVFAKAGTTIVSYDLVTGEERWRRTDTNASPAATVTYHNGVLVLEQSSWRDDRENCGILVYSGQDGRPLWQRTHRPDMTHYQEARAFFVRGLLWLQTEGNRVVGLEPLTGEQKQVWRSRGKHCASPVATDRFFLAPECDFTDLETGQHTRARMFKSACRLPFIPANGLLYTFPVQCECYPMLRGYMALASDPTPAPTAGPRLIEGPAYARASAATRQSGAREADWPTYRGDSLRSGSTPAALRVANPKIVWRTAVAQAPEGALAADWKGNPFVRGLVTPPVAADGTVLAAVPDQHRVVALQAQDGAVRWTFTAGGRIDLPPTIDAGRCLFGSHDGWVYCLDLAEGELVWKFRAAPAPTRVVAYGQIESLWPVPGNVLVDEGRAYFVAGRHPLADGGLRVYALEARSGRLVWEKTVEDVAITNWYGGLVAPKRKIGVDFEPVDILVKDGPGVAMSRWRFEAQSGEVQLDLASLDFQAHGQTVPRGLWGYGIRQTKSVDPKPPAVFDASGLQTGTSSDAALLLAGGALVRATTDGQVRVGEHALQLAAPAVPDGLIAARGRLYLSTQDGALVCLE